MVEEIFKTLSSHMVKGVMIHNQMADYYEFLNLHGYKRCHEYHGLCEMRLYRKLHRYYIDHYNKLIEEENIENPDVIPTSWHKYTRQEVDAGTKRNAVKAGIEKWVSWEQETKALYEKVYKELIETGDVAAAEFITCLICGADKELEWAQRTHIDLVTSDYSINYILGQQDHLHNWYKKKMRCVYDKHGADKR